MECCKQALPSDDKELALFNLEFPELLLALKGRGFTTARGGIGARLILGKLFRRLDDW
jgi:hypothetical protein